MEPREKKQKNVLLNEEEIFTLSLEGIILFTFLFLLVLDASSQKIWETRKGCIRSQGNIAGGYLFAQKTPSAYLNGDMDLFLQDRVAFTGSAFYSFALNRSNQTGIKANHAVFGGFNYHFLKPSRWDPYIGLSPGLGVVQIAYKDGDEIRGTPNTPVPLVSAAIGCNYYIGSIFHFFVKFQGVAGQVFSTLPAPSRLDELKFMVGLGWNLRLWKPKTKDKCEDKG
ncbi:MAG: hypothetical protein V4615_01895 [Bacteroidota bacterium]